MEGLLETISPSPTFHNWESEAQWRVDLPQVTDSGAQNVARVFLCTRLFFRIFL